MPCLLAWFLKSSLLFQKGRWTVYPWSDPVELLMFMAQRCVTDKNTKNSIIYNKQFIYHCD